ncbi:non-specific lipid-transfer protein 1-like [Malus sylvestris]|nr:non-specific lipid-transfer protein 1-like [Malus domestica]XP_050109345.1 non-specific lipid-transfer protein 1-like [Malus sylvestris]
MARFSVIVAIVFLFVIAPFVSNATITCGEVVAWLTPCIPFGVFGGTVPPDCCKGIKELNAAQNTTMDRRIACSCIQEGAAAIPGINYDRINTLGDVCGSPCPYKVYPSTNCSAVS